MIRFANPSADIDCYTRVFQAICEEHMDKQPFTFDDITNVLISKNLVTSSGYTGEIAKDKSYNKNRTKDKLFNQSKMYSEIFRLMGWISPADSKQSFVITWLGSHIYKAGTKSKAMVSASVLGIVFPNMNVNPKSKCVMRPFSLILRSMYDLDGFISTDEMILGPLSIQDDTNKIEYDKMIAYIRNCRTQSIDFLFSELKNLSVKLGIQENTLTNYTRFPVAVLHWTGWTKKTRLKAYGKNKLFFKLTDVGVEKVAHIRQSKDIRISQVKDSSCIESLSKLGALSMFHDSDFDMSSHDNEVIQCKDELIKNGILTSVDESVLFSTFQELSTCVQESIFGKIGSNSIETPKETVANSKSVNSRESYVSHIQLKDHSLLITDTSECCKILNEHKKDGKTPEESAQLMMQLYDKSNQDVFYRVVAELFGCMGHNCVLTRPGVNSERRDAFIIHATHSIPIEIKSPGEEQFIGVKGVRQALENKIILSTRKQSPTTSDTTSLVVGYMLPNNRAEVAALVHDIYKTFSVSIGILGFKSLCLLAANYINGKSYDYENFIKIRGIIHVE